MKNLNFLLLIIATYAFISSCSSDPSEMIVGKWKIADIKTSTEISEDQMDAYNEQIEEMKNSSKITFKADGSFEQTILEETSTGNWKISEDGKTLTKKNEDGSSENLKIEKLTNDEMVIVSEFDDVKTTTSFKKEK